MPVSYYTIPTVRPMSVLIPGTGSWAMWYQRNTPDGQISQYIRITSVDHLAVTFTCSIGCEYVDFDRRTTKVLIRALLIETFPGAQLASGVPGGRVILVQTTLVDDSQALGRGREVVSEYGFFIGCISTI